MPFLLILLSIRHASEECISRVERPITTVWVCFKWNPKGNWAKMVATQAYKNEKMRALKP